MQVEGLTNCGTCGEHFRTMERLWNHEGSAHGTSERGLLPTLGAFDGAETSELL